MRRLRRDVDDIPGAQFPRFSAFDRRPAHLTRSGFPSVYHLSAGYECGLSALDHEDVGLRFMQLRFPVPFTMRDHEKVVAEPAELLAGDLLRIDLGRQLFF